MMIIRNTLLKMDVPTTIISGEEDTHFLSDRATIFESANGDHLEHPAENPCSYHHHY